MNDNHIDEWTLLIERGHRASHLLNDPVFQAVVTELLQATVAKWANSDVAHHKERESAFHQHRALVEIVDHLKVMILTGQQIEAEEEEEEGAKEA